MNIEDFIKANAREFNCDEDCPLSEHHEQKFLIKLHNRFKELISIVPYLIRLLVVSFFVTILSVIIWDNYIRRDRHEITLKEKIVVLYQKFKSM